MTTIEDLAAEQYVSVTTFRKNGAAVPTPVWAALDGDGMVIWTVASSGKVKRVRADPRVVVAACDVRGNTRGEQVGGRASELPAEETERVRRLILKKYGLTARVLMIVSRIRRGENGTVGIRIVPDA
ncbi:PPOX class F420-dependent oxidoreductase [Streptosporangium sp. NPDC051023]|uniref:PPOX class F420-dependent oxidoreductase n=1 Tax=Streptosporangium sp. NPDC051023 TaxID=3155410 RepID=UPI00344E9DF0